jgi:HD-GYP domain-containing protein (c-di-GMP phosphodiesterase class II)
MPDSAAWSPAAFSLCVERIHAVEKKVSTCHLKLGMYVSKLDRPWIETPFLFQGFYINDDREIASLTQYSKYVYIDSDKGEDADHSFTEKVPEQPAGDDITKLLAQYAGKPVYEDTATVEQEMEVARETHREASETIASVMEDVRHGRKIDALGLKKTVNGVISSILRNPDAFTWLTKLKGKDSYTYGHVLDASILATTFGRHLGLSREELENLAIGTLMFDVGKMKLPAALLTKPGRLTAEEFQLVREHVLLGMELIKSTKGIRQEAVDIVMNHHERHNGEGYPRGLKGDRIPLYARIAGIVDVYDAITSDRTYARAMSEHDAIRKLYEWRNIDFQNELIEQFIQCMGVYPTGSLIELSTGEVGIVLSQNRYRRLRPKVMVILDKDKVAYDSPVTVDLITCEVDACGRPLEIRNSVEPGSFGIDSKEYYL